MDEVNKKYACHGSSDLSWLLTAESRIQFQVSPRKICGGQSGIGTGFFPSTSVFPSHYHSTNAPHSVIHVSLKLHGTG
jgi:hypothetical protein